MNRAFNPFGRRTCGALVALLVPALQSCESVHPAMQGAAVGAVGCGAVGGAVSGRKTAGHAAAACGLLGGLVGLQLESTRSSAEAREARAREQIVALRRATQDVQAHNAQLRQEWDGLSQLAAQQRTRSAFSSREQETIRSRIAAAQAEARQNLAHYSSLASQTRGAMNQLRRDDPLFAQKHREMHAYLGALGNAEANLRGILEVNL